ncbi:MAG: CBS domain-containing protein [Lewinellaceae bacterium]|nr:CBS domain-containing protein [Phaeodactylibacter sp.]MCB9347235.1 CBS domain-containing protein [Lewinellaceae bacterium]
MGELSVKPIAESRNKFIKALLQDIQALDQMLHEGLFEKGHQRVGAEQEIFLADDLFQPTGAAPDLLEVLPISFTSEIARYNLEVNLDPFELDGQAFQKTERQLREMLSILGKEAPKFNAVPILTGILPTLRHCHLELQHMTPQIRYSILSEAMRRRRGSDFEIHIQGADELIARLDSVMFEACNTSWQLHLQIPPELFAEHYNWAQWIAGPVLAACANSPLLFGRELWHETRIALFQQSVDTRSSNNHLRNKLSRVGFGQNWLTGSASNLFKDNISRFPLLLTGDIKENALETLAKGQAPTLRALRLHNGTVYSWNRPCYGISDTGFPHLRIENRYLPAGPSVPDEIANFAFWVGLMKGMPEQYGTLCDKAPFQMAKDNFYRAARSSLSTVFNWNGQQIPAPNLILEKLLPIAEDGLRAVGVDSLEIDRYLGIIERRALLRQNGALWMIRNFRKLSDSCGKGVAVQELTSAVMERQRGGAPVHEWEDVDCNHFYEVGSGRETVGRAMKTDLFTISQEEPLELVAAIMHWKNIRHLPVEDEEGKLAGLITSTNLKQAQDPENHIAADIMVRDLITAHEDMPLAEGAALIKRNGIGSLLIVRNENLVGILTDTDFRRLYGNF